jgi:hypothetical protein
MTRGEISRRMHSTIEHQILMASSHQCGIMSQKYYRFALTKSTVCCEGGGYLLPLSSPLPQMVAN